MNRFLAVAFFAVVVSLALGCEPDQVKATPPPEPAEKPKQTAPKTVALTDAEAALVHDFLVREEQWKIEQEQLPVDEAKILQQIKIDHKLSPLRTLHIDDESGKVIEDGEATGNEPCSREGDMEICKLQ